MKFQKASARNIALLKVKEAKGALRLVTEGVFTDDLSTPLIQLVAQNAEELAFVLGFSGRVAFASALPGVHQESTFHLLGTESKTVNVHGLTLEQSKGSEEELNPTETCDGSFLRTATAERAIVENIDPRSSGSKTNPVAARILLEEKFRHAPTNERSILKSKLRAISQAVAVEAWPAIENVLLPFEDIPAPKIDREVVSILGRLKSLLTQTSDSPQPPLSLTDAALFLEVYLSNFIEGSCVQIDEARCVLKGEAPCNGLAMLDVLKLKEVIAKDLKAPPVWRNQSDWMDWMKSAHQDFFAHREDKNPGGFKRMKNYAGSTTFTLPSLVEETLEKIFEMGQNLPEGWIRGCFLKAGFLMVHPFEDGNGRIGRLILNQCLTNVRERRFIVPNVLREDYLLGMAALSRGEVNTYVRMMNKVRELTHMASVDASLDKSIEVWRNMSAFEDSQNGRWGRLPEQKEASSHAHTFKVG